MEIPMKKINIAAALFALSLPVGAQALEFQTPGALGIGRAGVARTTDANAAFWNPAGLAFHEKSFSAKLNGATGVIINKSLAESLDKVGKIDTNNLSYTPTGNAVLDAKIASDSTINAVKTLALIYDIQQTKGELTVNVDFTLALQYQNFALGAGGFSEFAAGSAKVDTSNMRLGSAASSGDALTNFQGLITTMNGGVAVGGGTANIQSYFNQTQWDSVVAKIKLAIPGASTAEAAAFANQIGARMAVPGAQLAGQTVDQVVAGLTLAAQAFGGGSVAANNSTIELTGIGIAEVPIAYGHKFELGRFGKLGLGASVKAMQGTVYWQEAVIVKNFINGSSDFIKNAKDNRADSTTFGVDAGLLWRYEDFTSLGPINFGIVGKNLNSPKFDGPVISNLGIITKTSQQTSITVKPQARAGIALEPADWLSMAVDMDVTVNNTIMAGRKSQNIGGGVDMHWAYAALRLGAYNNIALAGSKPVITAGLGLGPKWLRFDIDAAASTDTGVYDGTTYPRETKVEFGLSTMF
jgi:hypothetical protein